LPQKQVLLSFALAATLVTTSSHAASKDIVDTAVEAGWQNLAAALPGSRSGQTLKVGAFPRSCYGWLFAKLPKGTVEETLPSLKTNGS
jgi:hypothetical protein